MKKRILSVSLVAAMLAVGVVGGTMAYLNDSDYDKNVMTAGYVTIEQLEEDQAGNDVSGGSFHLVPAVGTPDYTVNEYGVKVFDDAQFKNVKDKFISVVNTGSENAFVRTIILMEAAGSELVGTLNDDCDGQAMNPVWLGDGTNLQVTVSGEVYDVYVCTYNTALTPGQESEPSLKQVYLNNAADNTWYDTIGADHAFNIHAFSQAVQEQGFSDANTALNTAFGEVNAENMAAWIASLNIQ